MYKDKDPRIELLKVESNLKMFNDETVSKFYDSPPIISNEFEKTWVTRGQNFYLVYSELQSGAELKHANQKDEYAIISFDKGNAIEIEWGNFKTAFHGQKVGFVPPGESNLKVKENSKIVRLYTKWNETFKEFADNMMNYIENHYHIPELEAWPLPKEESVKVYDLYVEPDGKRFGTIYRSRYFMINAIDISKGPRDITKLSPHSHDDFQQCSLVTEGEFIHHLRWPWMEDKNQWREDKHLKVSDVSAVVIPPGVIHTTEAIGTNENKLIDIFCPPRIDFSEKEGWVLNAADYPL